MKSLERGSEGVELQGTYKTMGKLVKTGSKYSNEQRRQVVVEYCIKGNDQAVANSTGITRQTINTWRLHSDWWDSLVDEVRQEINEQILAQNMEIATKAGERVLDSLENGDEKLVWDKDKGKHVIKRVKPSGKDSMVISGISQDKARVQLNLPTSILSSQASDAQIKAVMDKCFALGSEVKQVNSIPGECVEVADQSARSNTKKGKSKKIK